MLQGAVRIPEASTDDADLRPEGARVEALVGQPLAAVVNHHPLAVKLADYHTRQRTAALAMHQTYCPSFLR